MAPSLARPASPAATGSLRNAPGRGPRPDPTTLARRAHGASPGGHRIRHGHRYPPGRGPDPRHPRRLRSRSFDHRSVGRRGRRPGRTRPGGARRGVHPRDPHARGGRDLFWGRPTLVGIEPASMTAVFCDAAADRKAETWVEQLALFDRLEFAISDAARGSPRRSRTSLRPAARTPKPRPWSTGWTSSTPGWRLDASWPGTGDESRRPGRRRRPPTSRWPGRDSRGSTPGV